MSRIKRDHNRYANKIALGLCRSGGCSRLPEPNRALCKRCLDHRKTYNRRNGYVTDSARPPAGYVCAKQLAKALGVWWNTIYRWQRSGCPTYRRYGRLWFSIQRVQAWREARGGIWNDL